MWFKNLQIYKINTGFDLDIEALTTQLQEFCFTPCSQQEQSRMGWVSPLGKHSTLLTHISQAAAMITLRKEEKVLPAAVIRDMVEEKAAHIEAQEERKVYRKEKEQIKEEILFECLPRALRKSRRTNAIIDMKARLILVDAASPNRAEELITHLRQSLGSLPLSQLQLNLSPAVLMSQWVAGESLPEGWELGQECELRESGDEGAIIRCRRHDLLSEEISMHMQAGKQVSQLALQWQQQLSFLLTQEGQVKRLGFGDDLKTEAENAGEDQASLMDSEFTVMLLTLRQFLPALFAALGDEKSEAI